MEQKRLVEKWVIIPLSVGNNEVKQIDWRMPSNVVSCAGVAVTVSDLAGFYYPHSLGELSLSLNYRKSQPACLPVKSVHCCFRMDYIICKLEEPIVGGSRIGGYYKNIVPLSYSIKIYLQCLQWESD